MKFLSEQGEPMNSIDLSCAELGEVDLVGAHLSGAHIVKSNLTLAKLDKADLQHAFLTDTAITGAKMRSSKLGDANFTCSRLTYVDFTGATFKDDEGKSAVFKDACYNKKAEGGRPKGLVIDNVDLADSLLDCSERPPSCTQDAPKAKTAKAQNLLEYFAALVFP